MPAMAMILSPVVSWLAACALAANFYVATTGSDSNPGTQASPWRTVAKAAAVMTAGDTTYVRGGTYTEGYIGFARSGTSIAPIRLLNYPGESPVIRWPDKTSTSAMIKLWAGATAPIGWIVIEGFEITNGYAISHHNAHDVVFRRLYIHDMHLGALGGSGTRVAYDRNILARSGRFAECEAYPPGTVNPATGYNVCNQDQLIYSSGSDYAITNNVIYGGLSYGIQVAAYPYNSAKDSGPEMKGATNWLIANNTIAYQMHRSGIIVWGAGGPVGGHIIENNILYENNQKGFSSYNSGIEFLHGGTGNIVRNNLFYATAPGGLGSITDTADQGPAYTASANQLQVDPKFAAAGPTIPAAPDFRLQAGSPAINAGIAEARVNTDLPGSTRPQGAAYDIGAYEYVSGTPTANGAPARPRNAVLR